MHNHPPALLLALILTSLLGPAEMRADPFIWQSPAVEANRVVVSVEVPKGHYLHAADTSVRIVGTAGESEPPDSAPATTAKTDKSGETVEILDAGSHTWSFSIPTFPDPAVKVEYQGCAETPFICFPPGELSFPLPTLSSKTAFSPGKMKPEPQPPPRADRETEFFKRLFARGGLWVLLAAFVGGLATAFTPCVLPLIPITLAVMGAGRTADTRLTAARRASLYVMGIVLSFTLMGLAASMAGRSFGFLLGNMWFQLALTVFFALMALSLLGLYDVSLPSWLQTKVNTIGGEGDKGAFLMGLVGGLVAVPCVGPVLATLLGLAASTANAALSASLLGAYALGFGTPLLIVGTGFARLPRSGAVMETAKSALGVTALILATYVATLVSPPLNTFLMRPSEVSKAVAVILIVAGALFGAFHLDGHDPRRRVRMAKLLGAAMIAFGTVWTLKIPIDRESAVSGLAWGADVDRAFAEAVRSGKPFCLEFRADWCAACKELETVTFSDPKVATALQNGWVLARVDGTRNSLVLKEMESRFKIKGYPTIILFSPAGRELWRTAGFIGPSPFLQALHQEERKK